jgi:phosphatidylserine/phosphatidylglycerophosphate/cardiolipin synthase-like enzyme
MTTPPFNSTPPLSVADLIWSPVNAGAKLTGLIQEARHSIDATTELLDDPYVDSELIAAAKRGVRVRLILPLEPREAASNNAGIVLLASQGIDVRVTVGQFPSPTEPPYMHAKTMIVDGRLAYLASIDLQTSSVENDRELGVLFRHPRLIAALHKQFLVDWSAAQPASTDASPVTGISG